MNCTTGHPKIAFPFVLIMLPDNFAEYLSFSLFREIINHSLHCFSMSLLILCFSVTSQPFLFLRGTLFTQVFQKGSNISTSIFFKLNVPNIRANTQLLSLVLLGYIEEKVQTLQNQFPSNNNANGKDKSLICVLICNCNRLKHGLLTLLFTLGNNTSLW